MLSKCKKFVYVFALMFAYDMRDIIEVGGIEYCDIQ